VVRSVVTADELHRGVTCAVVTVGALALLLLAAAVLAADRLALWLSRPVRELAVAADALRDGELQTRVPETGPPEVVASAAALNRLAARISELLAAERDSVADLSHRLRTPVTALRLEAESLPATAGAERVRERVAALERAVDAIVHDARRPTRAAVGTSCDAAAGVRNRIAFWHRWLRTRDGGSPSTCLPVRCPWHFTRTTWPTSSTSWSTTSSPTRRTAPTSA